MSEKWARTESTVEAWSPEEVRAQKINFLPPEVVEAVNELLAKNWSGYSATVMISEMKALASQKMRTNGSPNLGKDFNKEGWYDFEPIFEDKGWKVMCDSPGYNESGETHWVFTKKGR
jgi:hypothetical protein